MTTYFTLKNVATGNVVDLEHGKTDPYTHCVLATPNGEDSQLWYWAGKMLVNKKADRAMLVNTHSSYIMIDDCLQSITQLFNMEGHTLQPIVDVKKSVTISAKNIGAKLVIAGSHGGVEQQFTLHSTKSNSETPQQSNATPSPNPYRDQSVMYQGGKYQLVNQQTGFVLEVNQKVPKPATIGNFVTLGVKHNPASGQQIWRFEKEGLINEQTNMMLSIDKSKGNALTILPPCGQANQKFILSSRGILQCAMESLCVDVDKAIPGSQVYCQPASHQPQQVFSVHPVQAPQQVQATYQQQSYQPQQPAYQSNPPQNPYQQQQYQQYQQQYQQQYHQQQAPQYQQQQPQAPQQQYYPEPTRNLPPPPKIHRVPSSSLDLKKPQLQPNPTLVPYDQAVLLKPLRASLYMHINDGSPGSSVFTWNQTSTTMQKWIFLNDGYIVSAYDLTLCLELDTKTGYVHVARKKLPSGMDLVEDRIAVQKWNVFAAGKDKYIATVYNPELVLSMSGSSNFTSGDRLMVSKVVLNNAHQRWKLKTADLSKSYVKSLVPFNATSRIVHLQTKGSLDVNIGQGFIENTELVTRLGSTPLVPRSNHWIFEETGFISHAQNRQFVIAVNDGAEGENLKIQRRRIGSLGQKWLIVQEDKHKRFLSALNSSMLVESRGGHQPLCLASIANKPPTYGLFKFETV